MNNLKFTSGSVTKKTKYKHYSTCYTADNKLGVQSMIEIFYWKSISCSEDRFISLFEVRSDLLRYYISNDQWMSSDFIPQPMIYLNCLYIELDTFLVLN